METGEGDYSISEAKNKLPRLVHEAEAGKRVRLTRRGKSVAVLLSRGEYDALTSARQYPGRGVWDGVREWRAEYGGVDLDDGEIDSWRDRSLPEAPDL